MYTYQGYCDSNAFIYYYSSYSTTMKREEQSTEELQGFFIMTGDLKNADMRVSVNCTGISVCCSLLVENCVI